MRRFADQRGQTLLELMIVFPVVIGFVLASIGAADRIGLRLAVHWAARHAARAAAVNVLGEPCTAARAAAAQSLAPWRLRSLDVYCALRTPHGDKPLRDAPLGEAEARKARIQVRLEARGRGHAAASAAFPVMYAPR